MRIIFLKIAEAELEQAIQYYESEQPGLGLRFRDEVLRALKLIVQYPAAFRSLGRRSRRCPVATFPYGILYQYRKDAGEILVLAVAHLHRKSDYWLSRRF